MFFAEQTILRAERISTLMDGRARVKSPESLVRTHKEGVACGSVSGPPNLKSVAAIHREAPTIPLDPPGNGPDVTQIKKIRQHKSKVFCKSHLAKRAPSRKIHAAFPRCSHRSKK
jgi:hypothetical protein